jgi:hypothetical protein
VISPIDGDDACAARSRSGAQPERLGGAGRSLVGKNGLGCRSRIETGEENMVLRGLAAIAGLAALALVSAPVHAETVTKRTVVHGDRTVITSRDESGRTRTKIIVNRRSFLDPGKELFPGENSDNDGPALVYQPAFSSSSDGTIFDRGQPPLPGRFELPFKDNPIDRP